MTYARVLLTVGVAALSAGCAASTAQVRATTPDFSRYTQMGLYVVSEREREMPRELTPHAVRLLAGRGYEIAESRVVTSDVGGTQREAVEAADSTIAARGRELGAGAMFVVRFVPVTEPNATGDFTRQQVTVTVHFDVIESATGQRIWNGWRRDNVERRDIWPEIGHLLQEMTDRFPRRGGG